MYDSVNNPARMAMQIGIQGPPSGAANQPANYASSVWLYETNEDTHIQVEAAGYFSNGGTLGMKLGDLVIVSSTVANGGGITLHAVISVVAAVGSLNPPGAATVGGASGAQNSVATALVATGTTQATALALEADINMFATVAANSGAILPAMNPGDALTVFNGGANSLKLYPPVGAQINAVGANNAYAIATATSLCEVTCVSATQYLARQSA
jgi:hypothetical protein